jgi:D-sedoheptulose 7-phosphate isomerase
MKIEMDYVAAHFAASQTVIEGVLADRAILQVMVEIADLWADRIADGGKVMLAGNGGSAADSQHIAGELLSRLNFDRPALAGLALTTDTSVLTAIGNDYGYDRVFERQVIGLGRPNDVFVGISTSGRSPNILRALTAARELGIRTVGFAGRTGGDMAQLCDICLKVPSDSTPLIQQVHITAAHAICGLVEERIFGNSIMRRVS